MPSSGPATALTVASSSSLHTAQRDQSPEEEASLAPAPKPLEVSASSQMRHVVVAAPKRARCSA